MVFSDKRHNKKKDIPLRKCLVCLKVIPRNTRAGEKRIRPAQYIFSRFCGLKCKGQWQRENNKAENNANWRGGAERCVSCKIVLPHRYYNRNKSLCRKCFISSDFNKMEKHWNWQGGKTEASLLERNRKSYKLWREAVFKRDNYTCVWCGDARGGNLNADHIKPFALFPELRLDIENGRTLCTPCHKKTDTWGHKTKKTSQ